ncbi:YoaK family protein [Bryocella elongata]|nr:YoaK family protein [Bryocella elongata]
MPLLHLTSRIRSRIANVRLAAMLAFAAGLVDVSGFLGLKQFTSHMTGITAELAAGLGTDQPGLLERSAVIFMSFLAGAAVCALLVNFSRRRERESLFALPLFLEAVLLAAVGVLVHGMTHGFLLLGVLAFAMGLQNAIITKISDAEIRTTHVTGMVTDIGIELGRALYMSRNPAHEPIHVHRDRLGTLVLLVGAFFAGGLVAALVFPRFGFAAFIPLALLLAAPTLPPIVADLRGMRS